jgi:hypothetical protein
VGSAVERPAGGQCRRDVREWDPCDGSIRRIAGLPLCSFGRPILFKNQRRDGRSGGRNERRSSRRGRLALRRSGTCSRIPLIKG